MAIDPPPPDPERERLLALRDFSMRRIERARQKLEAAQFNYMLAHDQLAADQNALLEYDEAHPPAQPDLF